MAVEYDISSDVAVIKETGSVSQCARVTQMYSGQITYDDEAGSKFATATINGKSQRVMLCIAVNGTVNYDDVPSLYSTVDGHRCLNIVTPTETGTPDDVPSLYETVVIDGQNVRAVRCIMINKTPVYDGVSSVCTFTGDDGKTHTAQLVNKITGGSVQVIIKGTSPLVLPDAIANSLSYVKAFGGTEQRNIPVEYTQVNYVTNTTATAVSTGVMMDITKKYELEVRCRAVTGSWYILQSRASGGSITGISGSSTGNTIIAQWAGVGVSSGISRTLGNTLYVKATFDNGNITLYVKDETAGTEDTATGTYSTSAANPSTPVYLWGNAKGDRVDINSDVYMVRIKENGVTLVDWIPCRQSTTAGFYDTITDTLITATTPSDVTADGDAVPSPDTPMDIVSNNGVLKLSNYRGDIPGNVAELPSSSFLESMVLDPNKTYTLSFQVSADFSATLVSIPDWLFSLRLGDRGVANISTEQVNSAAGTVFTRTFTNIDKVRMRNAIGVSITSGALTNIQITDGSVYADGTVETINIHTTNIFNKNDTASIGNWYSSSTLKITAAAANQTLVMRAKPGATYYYKHCSVTGGGRAFYTEVEDWDIGSDCSAMVGGTTIDKDEVRSITVSENAKWVFFIYGRSNQTATFEEQLADYMVSLTPLTSDTQYAPYYDGGTATAEMLLKVGDYQDVQSIIDGVVTRNVGVLVFDGTENWSRASSNDASGNRVFYFVFSDRDTGNSLPMLSTHFSYKGSGSYTTLVSGAFLSNATNRAVYFDGNGITTVEDFQQYLAEQYAAGTPVIVVYPLATPTTESVTGQTLQLTDGDNTLEITQASLTGLELEAQYNAAVSLTIQEVEDANLDNNVTVTIQ